MLMIGNRKPQSMNMPIPGMNGMKRNAAFIARYAIRSAKFSSFKSAPNGSNQRRGLLSSLDVYGCVSGPLKIAGGDLSKKVTMTSRTLQENRLIIRPIN